MKATVTKTSHIRFPTQPIEMNFNTLEDLRDFVLSTGHSVIISVPQKVRFAANGGIESREVIPDTLEIEIYDASRE